MRQIDYGFEVKKIKLTADKELAYVDIGEGPYTLIFLHGLSNFVPVWKQNIEYLKHQYRCVALDLPGHGLSSFPSGQINMAYYAETVAELMFLLNLPNIVLVGHSMGGHIAVLLTLAYPAFVKKLILAAPAGFEVFSKSEIAMLTAYGNYFNAKPSKPAAGPQAALMKMYLKNLPGYAKKAFNEMNKAMQADEKSKKNNTIIHQSMEAMLSTPIFQQLHKVQCPTLVMFGENDPLIPSPYLGRKNTTTEIAKAGASKIPKSKLVMIPACGHWLQNERPEVVNNEIANFLTS